MRKIYQLENQIMRKMRHKHCMTWNIARNTEKRWKMRNILGVCDSFQKFFTFLAIIQILQCIFLIFDDFQFSCHTPGLTLVQFSFSKFLSIFLPYSRSYSVCVSFSTFFSFFIIIQGLQCVYLIFHVFECFSPYFMTYSVCFSFSMIFSFLTIFQVLPCAFLIFHIFEYFSPYSRSYTICVSFFWFFTFLAIIQVLQDVFLISHVF